MQMQTLYPKPGQRVRLQNCGPFQLPNGLTPGQEVEVIGSHGGPYFVVRDDSGNEYRPIPCQCLEMEHAYLWEGRWRREKHPAVLAHLKEIADELEATRDRWPSGIEWANQEVIDYNRRALAKWGALGYFPAETTLVMSPERAAT